MLLLKIVHHDMSAYGGFIWPASGPVECPDWKPTTNCGNGLHGWANGEGSYRHGFNDGKFLVVDCDESTAVSIGGDKVKIPRGTVVYCGTREGAVAYLVQHGALNYRSNPAWVCLTPSQLVTVALRAADRAVRKSAPKALRRAGLKAQADKLESLPVIDSEAKASAARSEARKTANAADAAAYAAANAAAYAAAYAAYAADAAAYAADAAANAAYAAYAAYAAANAAYAAYAAYAADAAANAANEREACRLDKLEMLGIKPA